MDGSTENGKYLLMFSSV